MLAVIDGLELARAVLVGHSLGGQVALLVAARSPERLAGLVLADSGPELNAAAVDFIRAGNRSAPPTFRSVDDYQRFLAARQPLAGGAALGRLARAGLRARSDGLLEPRLDPEFRGSGHFVRTGARYVDAELEAALPAIRLPTLVVRGRASSVLPADAAARMAEALREGALVTLPRAGHALMLDNPAAFAAALGEFVRGIDGGG